MPSRTVLGMAIAGVAVWFGDPCGPFAASSDGSAYDEFSAGVMGGFGLLYLAGGIPAAIWRKRKLAWLIVVLTFLVATVGAIAVVATAAPAGTYCDLGGGY